MSKVTPVDFFIKTDECYTIFMILIRGAEIIDGTGKNPFKADVLIRKNRLSAIGNFPNHKAELIIDGLGSVLTPGFIDVNTSSDHYLGLLTDPEQKDFLLQGVTTIIGGNCGSSLAPLLYGTLESVRKWADTNKINVNWQTMREFLVLLEKRGLGVNFGTLVGHSTIRRALIGESLRDLTVKELAVFTSILEEALGQGALGFSTGLGYAHSRGVPYEEIRILASAVAKMHGVYATHLRDEKEDVGVSVAETIRLGRDTGIKILISHFRPLLGFENYFSEALEILDKNCEGLSIYFDSYPSDTSLVPIYTLLPEWAKNGGLEVMLKNLRAQNLKERILKALPALKARDLIIAQAPRAPYLVGRTLGEIAENLEVDLSSAVLKIMEATKMRAVIFYRNINMDFAIQSLAHNAALIASNSSSFDHGSMHIRHERIMNTFPKFLEVVSQTKLMPLSRAIEKITSMPAKIFNLAERGAIKEGNIADLTMSKDGTVTNVFVGGSLAVKDGVFQNILAGKVLRSS